MKKLQLVFSDAAVVDILEQADWYAAQSGPALSRRWERSVTSCVIAGDRKSGDGKTLCIPVNGIAQR